MNVNPPTLGEILARPLYLLDGLSVTSTAITWEFCTALCINYQWAGIDAGTNCRCGNNFTYTPIRAQESLCASPCTGNTGQFCGGINRLTMFRNPNYLSVEAIASVRLSLGLPQLPALIGPSGLIPLVSPFFVLLVRVGKLKSVPVFQGIVLYVLTFIWFLHKALCNGRKLEVFQIYFETPENRQFKYRCMKDVKVKVARELACHVNQVIYQ